MRENKTNFLLIFAPCITLLTFGDVCAAVRINNSVNGNAIHKQQMLSAQQQAAYATTNTLPISVTDQNLANQIANGDTSAGVSVQDLNSCAAIYPEGNFSWALPNVGTKGIGTPQQQCVAVVEMRAMGAGPGGTDVIVARANLAVGDSITCNIDEFPDSGLTVEAANVSFPADNPPTEQDVINVMNQEQKQNAGIKIAASALVAALGANVLSNMDNDKAIGTDKESLIKTSIAGAGAAAIAAGGAFGGKVGGDMILSAGMNATAGGIIGNITASGDEILKIEDCVIDGEKAKCIWGQIDNGENVGTDASAYVNIDKVNEFYFCKNGDKCITASLRDIKIDDIEKCAKPMLRITDECKDKISKANSDLYCLNTENYKMVNCDNNRSENAKCLKSGDNTVKFIQLTSAKRSGVKTAAQVKFTGNEHKFGGYKYSDWYTIKTQITDGETVYTRDAKGAGSLVNDKDDVFSNFYPIPIDAQDGSVVDFENDARMKSTLIGAGAGAGLGALSAYSGAKEEIQNRLVTAKREYDDSLLKFSCSTGKRYLGSYNEIIFIQDPNK